MGGNGRARPALAPEQSGGPSGSEDLKRQALVRAHLPLVRALARRYGGRGEDVEELVQVGALALVKASGRFDPDRGVAFASFATPAVEGDIRRYLSDRKRRVTQSASGGGDGSDAAAETDPAPGEESEHRLLLEDSMRVLDERERRIVFLRFQADMTERQIASKIGISQAHVSRLLEGALVKLRAEFEGPGSPDSDGKTEPVGAQQEQQPPAPEPRRRGGRAKASTGYSGRILVRMPSELHEQLAQAAEREDLSLNRYVTAALSTSVEPAQSSGRRSLRVALVANVAVVVVAAVIAVVLLVLALERGI
jgi:RNA polymerase sigma-B factor